MEQIVDRIRRLCAPLRDISDALLLALLSQSDCVPDCLNTGTILFERDESIIYWYLLLSGEIELYIPTSTGINNRNSNFGVAFNTAELSLAKNLNNGKIGRKVIRLKTIDAGAIFGELNLNSHSCSARVRQTSEFVRIPQNHFLSLYKKHADHLQPYIFVMNDLVAENLSILNAAQQSLCSKINNNYSTQQIYNFGEFQNELQNVGDNNLAQSSYNNYNNYQNDIMPEQKKCQQQIFYKNKQANFEDAILTEQNNFNNLQSVLLAQQSSANLFELNNIKSLESRVYEAALTLKRTMQLRSPWLISNHQTQGANEIEVYPNSMSGIELTRWLNELCCEVFSKNIKSPLIEFLPLEGSILSTNNFEELNYQPFNNLQLIGMWQALLDSHYIQNVCYEQQFKNKITFYQWSINDPYEEFYQSRAKFYLKSITPLLYSLPLKNNCSLSTATSALFNGVLLPPFSSQLSTTNFDSLLINSNYESSDDSDENIFDDIQLKRIKTKSLPKHSDLQNTIFLLSQLGVDALLTVILQKPPHERSLAELDLVYEELLHTKALSHLSTMMKRELTRVIRYEQHQHSGTVLFHQGDPGDSWYIIWRSGSVDVIVSENDVVYTLHEGDDFGKLALVNDTPRAATVALRENNSQFLRIDKHDFNRVLKDVESNTIRLNEHGQDVLVLERIPQTNLSNHNPGLQSTSNNLNTIRNVLVQKQEYCYSVMAGVPEKMVEYLLETRVDAATIYTVSLVDNSSQPTTSTTTTTTTPVSALITTPSNKTITPTKNFFNNYSSTFADNKNTSEALTKSCCINFSDLPLRYVDDLDTNCNGYASDRNINYCSNLKNSSFNLSSSINHLLQNQKTVLQQNSQALNVFVVENLDVSLEDFILTHVIFIPTNLLCNYLKIYYNKCRQISQDLSLPLPTQFNINNSFTNYKQSMESNLEEIQERFAAKRRVVLFLVIWQYILGLHFFLDPVANSFVEEIYCCVLEDANKIPNMESIVDQINQLRKLREYAMTILSRHPKQILDSGVFSSEAPSPNPILPFDICNQCIYLSDTTYITLNVRLDKTASEIIEMANAKIRRQHQIGDNHQQHFLTAAAAMQQNILTKNNNSVYYQKNQNEINNKVLFKNNGIIEEKSDECFLVEVKSNGERIVYSPTEISVPTMLSLNGRLYVIFAEEIDYLLPLPDQNGPSEIDHHSVLELIRSRELAQQLAIFHAQLFNATNEIELIFQVIGRDQFPGRNSSNLDLLLRRFNEVQYWTSTEVLLASSSSKRLNILKKFIKIATHAKQLGDLMSVFAITLGLSNVAVSRLSQLWIKLPTKLKRQYAEFEALLDPSRNHRAYRILVSKLNTPIVPFVPLLLKDLTFIHEGNKTSFANLINFEKMHMIANVLRNFRNCKSSNYQFRMIPTKKISSQGIIRNFRTIDNQRRLMELSYAIESPTSIKKSF